MNVYLGIDLGTTGLKSVLVREDGAVLGTGYRGYPILIPAPGYAEQDPLQWWDALRDSLADAMRGAGVRAGDVAGIGLSGQMHGTVLTGADGMPRAPAVIWCDQRSAQQKEAIRARLGDEALGRLVQNPVAVGFQVCTLLWLREHRPGLLEKTRRVLLPKDWLRLRLTGEWGTEPSDASSTLMFDCAARDWSGPMLETFGIDRGLLPDADHRSCEPQGGLTRAAADALGLRPGTPVVFGGGDQPMQALGNGILRPGVASVTLGTGGQVFAPLERPVYDPQLRTHTFCHATDGWYAMGAVLNCCLAQNWFFDKVLGTRDAARMHEAAAAVPPGSGGLVFLPYLTGERTPHMDPAARGMFFGLTLGHDAAAMTRAVIEGITCAVADAVDCVRQLCPEIRKLVLSGGGARSPLWRQILADMLETPLYASSMKEEAAVGAAICAMAGTGAYAGPEQACAAIVRYEDGCTEPDPARAAVYREERETFRALYRANRDLFPG